MPVLLVGPLPPLRGGIAHHTACLANALHRSTADNRVISFHRQYPARLYPGRSDRAPGASALAVIPQALFWLDCLSPRTWRLPFSLQPASHLILQWWTPFWALPYHLIARSARRAGGRVVFLVHNLLPHERRPLDALLSRLALAQGQAFMAHSPREANRLRKWFPGCEVACLAHPPYDWLNTRRMDKSEARSRLGLPFDRPLILFFGLVRPYKGLRILLEALALMKDEPGAPFLLAAGEFWERVEDTRRMVQRLGLQGCVRLDDRYIPDEEAAVLFSAADCLAAPYIGGTQSGAVALAQGFGLPVAVSDALFSLNEERKGLAVFPAGDAPALAAAIRRAVSWDGAGLDHQPSVTWDDLAAALLRLGGMA